jgi:O-succinylbenzoic acid--CoA ligase
VQGALHLSCGDLEARVNRRVAELRSQGLVEGQVVLAPAAPTLDSLVMQHALGRLECGYLPVAPRCADHHVQTLLSTAGVEWRWLMGAGSEGSLLPTGLGDSAAARHGARPALLVESSGSGGASKAVMLTTQNVRASAALVNERLGLEAGDCWLSCLPRTHVGGLMIAYRCALAGATVVLHEGFDAQAVGRDLDSRRVTHLSLVPPMLDRLLAVTGRPPRWLRVLLVGGQALDGTLARRAIDAGWPLHVTYGMTESASQIATSPRLETVPPMGVVGPLLRGIEVRCDGSAESPAPIRIRGAVLMAGYANPLRLPGLGLEEGWFSSCDLGYLTPGGDLAVLGRADEVLVIGGESVLPSRVEDRLRWAPGVDSAVVVGLPDPVWGHRLVAVYTGRIDPAGLDAWAREHLGSRERPREFRRLGRLPTLESGKTDRRGVRLMVADASAGP